jgi:riboflavin kinase/FMN adenylyltransferase
MLIHRGYENLFFVNPVVTMGIFDGVHRGHMSLLKLLVTRAKELKGESVVITFSPHPRMVLEKNHINLSFLSTMEEKILLLEKSGIDHLVIVRFDRDFSRIHACDFVRGVLVERIGTKHLMLGYDHRFGQEGEGDYNTVKECSESMNFSVEKVKGLFTEDGEISSSSIREYLLRGLIEKANDCLGYYYRIEGKVVQGKRIGRSIGFPTANIEAVDKYKLIPGNGVYAVEVEADGAIYPGMLSIGHNPTVQKERGERSVEVHILNFKKDIYNQKITVILRKRLRSEKKFKSIKELADQMEVDKENTLKLLS